MPDPNYRNILPLKSYIDRIGAEELNFRRFMVKEHRGEYYRERSLIIIMPDGTIRCSNKEHAPTEDEAKAIKEALIKEKFPQSRKAPRSQLVNLRKICTQNSTLYDFIDHEGEIIMVQERIVVRGAKFFIPWTFWSDGEWRKMEPEGALPLWRPRPKVEKDSIMIHEGVKAAKAVDEMVHDRKLREAHPWGEALAEYEHWGMIGGALAPHRTDYSMLSREKPTEVVYVCDNDFPGKSALQEVSRCYGGAMKGIMFDDRWRPSWDMADDMPKNLFKGSRYLGPSLEEMMQLATYATEIIPNPSGKGRPVTVMRPSFVEEWFHSVTPEVFIHKEWPNRILTAPEFNSVVKPFSDVDDTARLLKGDAASKSAVLKYNPADRSGIYGSGESGRYINTHMPCAIRAEDGDASPFLEFMEEFCQPEHDRRELLRWCATLIARPDIRMLYGTLMITENQGIGKGTLGEKILAPLVGSTNVSYPSEREIVESSFNYWLAHKRLAVVHEIYAGHSSKAYNQLKNIITDRYITVSKKYQANYDVENWLHVYACSNSMRALQLTMDDRRWLVPKLSERKRPASYWKSFNEWIVEEGGLAKIKHWAMAFCEAHGPVERGTDAPWTELKKEIVEENYSDGMALVARTLDHLRGIINGEDGDARRKLEQASMLRADEMIVLDEDFREMIRNKLYDGRPNDRLERPLTVRKVAKSKDWFIAETRVHPTPALRRSVAGSRMICSTRDLSARKPAELFGEEVPREARLLPVDLTGFIEL